MLALSSLKKTVYLFIYLFLERGEGREKERKRNVDVQEIHPSVASLTIPMGTLPATRACALTGNQTSNVLVHSLTLNPLSHTSQCSLSSLLSAVLKSQRTPLKETVALKVIADVQHQLSVLSFA